jgi:hypothetical protein
MELRVLSTWVAVAVAAAHHQEQAAQVAQA